MHVRTAPQTKAFLIESFQATGVCDTDVSVLNDLEAQLKHTGMTREKLQRIVDRRLKIKNYWGVGVYKMTSREMKTDIQQRVLVAWFSRHGLRIEDKISSITKQFAASVSTSNDNAMRVVESLSVTMLQNTRASAYSSRLSLVSWFKNIDSHMSDKCLLHDLQEQYEHTRDAEDKLIETINTRHSNLLRMQTVRQKKMGVIPQLNGKMRSKDASDRVMARWFKKHSYTIEHHISIIGANMPQTDFSLND